MEELTLRLPAETKASLQSEAEKRGTAVETHVRDIVDAYRSKRERRPTVRTEYMYSCQAGTELERIETEDDGSEEIGSFSYGSRSVLP